MPGPTPLPVRLTDKQRAELLLLREDDNSRLRARNHHYGVRRGAFEQRGCPAREHHPGDSGEVAQGLLWRWVQGFARCAARGSPGVLLLSFPMTSAKRCCATSAALRCRRASPARARIVMLCAQGHTDTEVAKIVAMGADTAVRTKA